MMALRSTKSTQLALKYRPAKLKRAVKGALAAWPDATLEMSLLQSCTWHLSWSKAAAVLGYEPQVSIEEGMRRSIAWLGCAGYPIALSVKTDSVTVRARGSRFAAD